MKDDGAAAQLVADGLMTTAMTRRLVAAQTHHNLAFVLASCLEKFKTALIAEKKAFSEYRVLLGDDHHLTVASEKYLRRFTEQAVEQSQRQRRVESDRDLIAAAAGHLHLSKGKAPSADEPAQKKSSKTKRRKQKKK